MNITYKHSILSLFLVILFFSNHLDASKRKHHSHHDDSVKIAFNIPEDFGKTHFIVGYPSQDLEQDRKKIEQTVCDESFGLICDGHIKQAYFAPDENVQKVLLYLIANEKKSIRLAAFSFTDGEVAQALIDAMNRGVELELVVDPGCIKDAFGKISLLQEQGIDVFIYDPGYKNNGKKGLIVSIMHNKFIIFANNILNKTILWTGSFNFTKSAHQRNHENVIVLDDQAVIGKYIQHFDLLKTRSKKPKKKRPAKPENQPLILSKKGTIFEDVAVA